jgi:DNA-binding transcriptional LysR family regulator
VARRLVEEFDASVISMSESSEQRRNQVTVASIPTAATYFLPRAMQSFKEAYPGVRLRVLECMPRDVLQCVLQGEADLGINLIGATEADVNYSHLLDDPYVFVCHRDHPLAERRTIRWSDLDHHALIRIGEPPASAASSGRVGESLNRTLLDNALSKMKIRLNWLYEAYYLTTVLSMVESGLGASVVPQVATPRITHPLLIVKPIGPFQITRAIGVLERRKAALSPAVQCLRDILLSDTRAPRASRRRPRAAQSSRG